MRRPNDHLQEPFLLCYDHPALSAEVAATGTITCVAKASMADTDYITIPDGYNPPVVYEFDEQGDGVTAGRVQVNISGATSDEDVATILKAAIEANQPLFTVEQAAGVLTLTHKAPGAAGNVTITENVANAGFLVTGMSGGLSATQNTTADRTVKLFKVPAGKNLVIDGVDYINPTGLAADNSNHFEIALKKGSTKMAAWSTDGNGTNFNGDANEGTIAADTFVALTLSETAANLHATGGDVLSLSLDETGTQSLPAGRIVVRGRWL